MTAHHCLDCGHQWGTPEGTIQTPTIANPQQDTTPADHLRDHWNWTDELTRQGWSVTKQKPGGETWWTRPGKNPRHGHSAVLHPDGPLVIFTTEIPYDLARLGTLTSDGSARSYSPLEWYAAHNHHGSISDASRALRAEMTGAAAGAVTVPAGIDPATGEVLSVSEDPDDQLRALLVDWPTFWTQEHGDAEWLAEPVIPAGRSTAIFAPGGTGKSLLSLWLAVNLATGRDPFTGRRQDPIDVLYLDYEMTADDLAERLEQMGHADADLEHLHYALLPSLPGLDEPDGGRAVVRLAEIVQASLVVIDTFGRAVHGDENDADTVRAWYRWTGLHLKHAGRAFVRIDHAGKDLAKGQRGTSAKNDDVDIVWQMTSRDNNAFDLVAKKRRMGWVPETVAVTLEDTDELHFSLTNGPSWPAGTAAVAADLDRLGVPVETTRKAARTALRDADIGCRNNVLGAAIRYRRDRDLAVDRGAESGPQGSGTASGGLSGTGLGTEEAESDF